MMNRIFKVIFNRGRGTYVVTGENARARGKTKSIATITALAMAGTLLAGPVMAEGIIITPENPQATVDASITEVEAAPVAFSNTNSTTSWNPTANVSIKTTVDGDVKGYVLGISTYADKSGTASTTITSENDITVTATRTNNVSMEDVAGIESRDNDGTGHASTTITAKSLKVTVSGENGQNYGLYTHTPEEADSANSTISIRATGEAGVNVQVSSNNAEGESAIGINGASGNVKLTTDTGSVTIDAKNPSNNMGIGILNAEGKIEIDSAKDITIAGNAYGIHQYMHDTNDSLVSLTAKGTNTVSNDKGGALSFYLGGGKIDLTGKENVLKGNSGTGFYGILMHTLNSTDQAVASMVATDGDNIIQDEMLGINIDQTSGKADVDMKAEKGANTITATNTGIYVRVSGAEASSQVNLDSAEGNTISGGNYGILAWPSNGAKSTVTLKSEKNNEVSAGAYYAIYAGQNASVSLESNTGDNKIHSDNYSAALVAPGGKLSLKTASGKNIVENSSSSINGGGIYNQGEVSLSGNTQFNGNSSKALGGAIYQDAP